MYDLKPYLEKIDRVIAQGPYQDTWESLSAYRVPAWYQNAKFGIFIHWGIYSVPAFGSEWYSRNMYIQGSPEYEHHIATYGKHAEFGYKDFIPMFQAEHFDPDKWAELFRKAGARYVVPVAEHHDGFQMYRSEISHWNACEMGPKRDVLGELKESCGRLGMQVGASSHRVEHWFFMGHGKEFDSDIKDPMERGDFYWPAMPEQDHHDLYSKPEPTEEFLQDWLVRTCEIIDRYRPKILYFDWWIQHSACKPWLKKFAAYYYNRAHEWGTDAVINYKHDAFLFGTAVPDGYCQQERYASAECGPQSGRNHLRTGYGGLASHRRMAEGQRGSDLWDKGLEKIRRRTDPDCGGAVLGRHQKELYLQGFPVYYRRRLSVCHCPEVQ